MLKKYTITAVSETAAKYMGDDFKNVVFNHVHTFPGGEPPDETMMRVFGAGPAGEPPPGYTYETNSRERWVFERSTGGYFMMVVPNAFFKVEEIT